MAGLHPEPRPSARGAAGFRSGARLRHPRRQGPNGFVFFGSQFFGGVERKLKWANQHFAGSLFLGLQLFVVQRETDL